MRTNFPNNSIAGEYLGRPCTEETADMSLSGPTVACTNARKNLKVLHVIQSWSVGGVETWLLELLHHWNAEGGTAPQVDFVVMGGRPGVFDDAVRALGARIFYLTFTRRNVMTFTRSFRRLLRDGEYDVIHDHQGTASGWHFLLGAGWLPPVRITHLHNAIFEIANRSLGRQLIARFGKILVVWFATDIVSTSQSLLDDYRFSDRTFRRIGRTIVYCGINPKRFRGNSGTVKSSICREFDWPEDAKIVLFVGRMDLSPDLGHPLNSKNSGFAVSVCIECARRDPKIHVLFIGAKTAAVPILEQRIASAGVSDRIRFTGIRHDIPGIMLASDALLFPSRAEGLGMVAVEAQASGLPVLASTAVPRECSIVHELVRFQAIDAGADRWAGDLLELIALPHDNATANKRISESAFNIENSTEKLTKIYLRTFGTTQL
jgi:glycosyltransferase involved in cell wall biosynthesis